ncbi:MAG: beta-Ala-His dipeptidase [Candidatus Gracilibacteria bacterium]|nr:beta-Ala-His dipeptidase [Candidatus Gracilibacteria bacterium]
MSKTLQYFKEITKYPRPSKKEEKIRDFLVNFFSKKGYKYIVDKTGNLIVYIPAKNSFSKETIILQSHMDMVCVKDEKSNHDFLKDSLKILEEDGFLKAKNTTLGADNGIGIALIMSAIDFEKYPNLEIIFTIDEEAGMSGILGLDFSLLNGTKIINLDFEDEDQICISSAGGVGISGNKELELEVGKLQKYELEIFGMKGGHSGVEIDKNRGNAILIFLDFISKYNGNIEIYKLNSGFAQNVIPSKINVILGIENIDKFRLELEKYIENTKNIYDCPEIGFSINENNENILKIKDGLNILIDLLKIKDGVYKISEKIPDLVQTSINLGILKIENNILKNIYLARSSNNEELTELVENIKKYLQEKGFEINFDKGYFGWQDDPNSQLLNIAKIEFEKELGKSPKVVAVHAGLECGILVSGLNKPGVNAISIGPNIFGAHSTKERVEIASIKKLENILERILEKL